LLGLADVFVIYSGHFYGFQLCPSSRRHSSLFVWSRLYTGATPEKQTDTIDDFNFPIVNFPFTCSNIRAAPAYGVSISQLIRYSRDCGSYHDTLDRGLLLTRKLLYQGFLLIKLKSSLLKYYGRHHDLVDRYGIYVSQMTTDMFHLW
jgi:hypothetical protein